MIICFSGTGNSRAVAVELGRFVHGGFREINAAFFDNPVVDLRGDKTVVWVFPVYSWGVPPVVRNAMKTIRFDSNDAVHHAVMTCGDDAGYAGKMFQADLRRRGFRPGGLSTVIMPNTYVCMKGFDVDSPDVVRKKIAAMPARVAAIAADLGGVDVVRGKYPFVKTRLVYPWFVRHAMNPAGFHATDQCIGCGRCAGVCPMQNIAMNDRQPVWRDNCAFCLECYHICPRHAVAYKNATEHKGQYLYENHEI